ncbi:hypothetical protein GYMLUDRAFT_238767 [Collybiopsis luxurians FD-317 M1]|nr:hypothetical protein GYMLUDRAFT_238767 [Collybiopsis luxurians FD-317 M1]
MSPCDDDLTTTSAQLASLPPTRHPKFSFKDGNLALLAQNCYFLVHQGLICRHSPVLQAAIKALESNPAVCLDGRPVLQVHDNSEDMLYFLIALYDGISDLPFTAESFVAVSALMRLTTKYQVHRLRKDLLRGLSLAWPSNLASWDAREEAMLSSDGVYEPRQFTPHPILIINLARSVNAHELLPSAFYDLSRFSISHTAAGHVARGSKECHQLSEEDLFNILKGREDASRFLSTFLVNQLEGRKPSSDCIYLRAGNHPRRRFCQVAFENIFYNVLRDTNNLVRYRSCDPLFSIMEAYTMNERDDGGRGVILRPCESCRSELRVEIEAARDEFWQALPIFFNIQVSSWG